MIVTLNKILKDNTYQPDLSGYPEDTWQVKGYSLNQDKQTYTVELKWIKDVPFIITQLQGMLQLDKMGILEQVEAIIEQSGTPAKIYWKTAQTWERTSPILNRLAPMIWPDNTEENLDKFFIEAKKLV